jgi:photosystem II stability/assembly factor-like uncharacterized protein
MNPGSRATRLLSILAIASLSYVSYAQTNVWILSGLNSPITSFAKNSSGHLFAIGGVAAASLYFSTDDGSSWLARSLPQGFPILTLGIGGDDYLYLGTFYEGVYRSTDAGQTWSKTSMGPGNVGKFLNVNGSGLYVTTYNWGVFRSTDNGVTWTPRNNGINTQSVCNDIIIGPAGALFVGTSLSGVFKSTDAGETWVQCSSGLNSSYVRILFMGPGNRLYAGTNDSVVFVSTNAGETWQFAGKGIGGSPVRDFCARTDSEVYVVTGGGIHRSTNDGLDWHQVNGGLQYQLLSAATTNSTGQVLVGAASGVFRRSQFLTASPDPPSLPSPPDQSNRVPLNALLSWDSTDGSVSFAVRMAHDTAFTTIVVEEDNLQVASFRPESLGYTTKYFWQACAANAEGRSAWSDTWSFTTVFPALKPPTMLSPYNAAPNIAINPTLEWRSIAYALKYTVQIGSDSDFATIVYENRDVSDTTVRVGGLEFGAKYFWRVRTIRTDSTSEWSAPWQFSTRSSGSSSSHFPLSVGNSWTLVSYQQSVPWWYLLRKVEKDTVLPDAYKYAAIRCYRRLVTDPEWTQEEWQFLRVDGGRVYMYPESILVDFDSTVGSCLSTGSSLPTCIIGDNQRDWLGRTARILTLSQNGGLDWWSFADSLGFAEIKRSWSHDYSPSWTIGACIDGIEYGTMLGVVEPSARQLPQTCLLYQNYPNPFNPKTGIRIQVPGVSQVRLAVFDLLGSEVTVLMDEKKEAGQYEVTWDASGCSSGVYVCRMTAGNFLDCKKMILIR